MSEKTPPMTPTVKLLIRGVNSNYVKADIANRIKDYGEELIHLLSASHDCCLVIGLYHSGGYGIDKKFALSYAKSGINTARRIEELVKGVKDE